MSIPPSRNKIRAGVLQEQRFQPNSGGGGFMGPNKTVEMGRKLVTWDELKAVTQIRDLEGLCNAKMEDCMDDDLGEASPDITRGIACCTAPLALQLGWERIREVHAVEAAQLGKEVGQAVGMVPATWLQETCMAFGQ